MPKRDDISPLDGPAENFRVVSRTRHYWLESEGGLEERSAADLVESFVSGQISEETLLRVTLAEKGRPLRRLLPELVIEANLDVSASNIRGEQIADAAFRLAFDHSPVGMVMSDFSGKLLYVNQAFADMVKRTPEDLVGTFVKTISHRDDREAEAEKASGLFSGRMRSYQLEKRFLARDGEAIPTLVHISAVVDSKGVPVMIVGNVVDLRERKSLEQALIQSGRMEALGRLAGGIAHDFNNLLMVIVGSASLLEMDLGKKHDDLTAIFEASQAGNRLTRQLLGYSRDSHVLGERVDLALVLESLSIILETGLPDNVHISIETKDPPLWIWANSGQLEQVILNLAFNARDAMPKGGHVWLSASCAANRDGQVCLLVRDDGPGMNEHTKKNLFEPFFTTRSQEGGTGLGLSTVHGIVKRFGGNIEVVSELGVGTSFFISWPRVEAGEELDARPPTDPTTRNANSPLSAGLIILLVEDQDPLRRSLSELLRRHGYTVIEKSSGEEAIAWLNEHNEVDIVLSDLVLGGVNGVQVTRQAKQNHPQVKVLLMSGDAGDVLDRQRLDLELEGILCKPFSRDELLQRLRLLSELPGAAPCRLRTQHGPAR